MAHIVYGVWNGAVHDYRDPGKSMPENAVVLRDLDVFDEGNAIRAFVGDRGFFVLDKGVSLIDTFWRYIDKAAEQSCGKCTPCRMGTVLVRDALNEMRQGRQSALDLDDRGDLWVRRTVADTLKAAFDVIDRSGKHIAVAEAPWRLAPFYHLVFRGDNVYGITRDDDGVPYVVRAKIGRS